MRRAGTEWASPRIGWRSCVAIRIGGRVAAFEAHLVAAQIAELDKEVRIELQAAFGFRVQLYHPAADALGIELNVPGRVERVGEVNAPAIAADLDHLRASVERRLGLLGMAGVAHDTAEMDRTGLLRVEGIGNVIL